MWAAALLSIHVQQLMVGSFALRLGTCPMWLVFEGAGLDSGAVAWSEASPTEPLAPLSPRPASGGTACNPPANDSFGSMSVLCISTAIHPSVSLPATPPQPLRARCFPTRAPLVHGSIICKRFAVSRSFVLFPIPSLSSAAASSSGGPS
jgi:hypothetical protein